MRRLGQDARGNISSCFYPSGYGNANGNNGGVRQIKTVLRATMATTATGVVVTIVVVVTTMTVATTVAAAGNVG